MFAQGGIHPRVTILVNKEGHPDFSPFVPISMLPRSKEAQEALIEHGAKALNKTLPNAEPWKTCLEWQREEFRVIARAVLASANLVEKE